MHLITQKKEGYCLCSFLQSTLKEEGIEISQDEIAGKLTKSEYGYLVHDDKIINFLKTRGFDYTFYWHNQTPFNEPDCLLREIAENRGFIALARHVYRVLDFKDPEINADDPEDGKTKSFKLHELMQELKKLGGGFGLLRKLKEK